MITNWIHAAGRFIGGLMVAGLAVTAAGQAPLFTEVQPVFSAGGAPLGHFPALKDMRSAWGDLDRDGDLDVILMGAGPGGPVTKMFLNEGTALEPFAFVEHPTFLPQLQDGALALGDMDRDGDLDLAITGSVTATPGSAADLRVNIFRNDGLSLGGFLQFVQIQPGPWFTPCFHGCVSWGDMDNDGDLDLFVSGQAWNSATGQADQKFARIHRQDRGNLTSSGPSFWNDAGVDKLRNGQTPGPEDGAVIRKAVWTDVDRDGLQDLMLTTAIDASADIPIVSSDYAQEVWLNARGRTGTPGDFERLGGSLEGRGLHVEPGTSSGWLGPLGPGRAFFLGASSLAGGLGDWDGDGHLDIAFNFEVESSDLDNVSRLSPVFFWRAASLPGDFIPGFADGPTPLYPGVAAQVSADFLNTGRAQWAGSIFPDAGGGGLGPPTFKLLFDGVVINRPGLVEDTVWTPGVPGRFRGALDVVDANGDGRLDLLHSGFDETVIVANPEPASRFYRNNVPSANTPPTAPGGLTTVQATSQRVRLRWNPATDAQTSSDALGYAIRLRHANGTPYLAPGARPDGKRLKPGREGVWELTEFSFEAYNGGNGSVLPDGTYYWTVQAVDSGGLGSPFAPEQTFIIGDPNPPPDDGQRDADLPYRDSAIDLGDVDNDGALDVVLAGSPPGTGGTIIRRNGGINPLNLDEFLFTAYGPDLPPVEHGAARWGDVDGDGDIDLALSGLSRGQPITRVYGNHGGTFQIRNVLEGVFASALDWGDFDNDGDLDLIVTGYRDGKPLTRLYRNGGELNAVPHALLVQPTTLPDIGDGAATWVDFDSDGDLDLLLNGNTQDSSQPPAPCVIPPVHLRPPGVSYLCVPGMMPGPKVMTVLLRNDGLATMGFDAGKWRFTPVPSGLPPVFGNYGARGRATRAEWSDFTGDGRPDLLLGGTRVAPAPSTYGWPSARTFRNTGPGPVLGTWQFVQGGELLDGLLDSSLQTLTCADWTQGAGLNGPDVLFGGWINGPGTVPAQVRSGNGGDYFVPSATTPFLPFKDDQNVPQLPGGLAAFGHFNEDANVDILLAARWGIQGAGGLGAAPADGRVFLASALPANLRPTPPTAPVAVANAQATEVTFSWGPSSDGGQLVQPTYNLHVERVDGLPGGMPGMADQGTGRRRVSRPGNVGHHLTWTLRGLPAGEYRWSVQAIDAALATSAFTNAPQTFTVAAPLVAVIHPLAPFHNWQAAHPAGASVDWFAVAAGRSARLIVGRRGQAFLSRQSGVFEAVESGVFTDLRGALIDSEGAMIVGDDGVIRISSDGVVWSESTSGTTASLRAVVRGDSGWVAAGDGVILRSTDRRNWTPGTMPANTLVHGLAAWPGRYVAAGERAGQKVLLTSTDGLAWTEVTPGGLTPGALFAVATDGTKFVAVGGHASFPGTHRVTLTSTDGQTWSAAQVNNEQPFLSVAHGSTGWIAVSEQSSYFSSVGATWQQITTPLPLANSFGIRLRAVAAADGLVTIVGAEGQIFDAPDSLAAWTQRGGSSYYTYGSPTYLAANGNRVVAVTSFNVQPLSDDGGATWSSGPYYGNSLNGVAFGQGRFVRSGAEGLQYSPDGVVWTNDITTPTSYASRVIFGDGIFLATRDNFLGGFYRSTTGRDWTIVGDGIPPSVGLARGLGMFLALDGSGRVRTSANGTSWSAPLTIGAQRLCFAHDRFFALYDNGDVRSSTDGLTWTPVNGLGLFGSVVLQEIIWHDNQFVAVGGPDAVLMISPDTVTWTRIPIPTSGKLYSALSTPAGLVVAGTEQALLFAPYVAPAPPPASLALGTPRQPAAGQLAFTVTGPPGQVVTLERSENLQDWTPVQTFTLSGGAETLEVEVPASPLNAFYRLSVPTL